MDIETIRALVSEASTIAVLLWFLSKDRERHAAEVSYYRGLIKDEIKDLRRG